MHVGWRTATGRPVRHPIAGCSNRCWSPPPRAYPDTLAACHRFDRVVSAADGPWRGSLQPQCILEALRCRRATFEGRNALPRAQPCSRIRDLQTFAGVCPGRRLAITEPRLSRRVESRSCAFVQRIVSFAALPRERRAMSWLAQVAPGCHPMPATLPREQDWRNQPIRSTRSLVWLTFFRSADRGLHMPAGLTPRTHEARGAEAPRQRTAAGRLLRRVRPLDLRRTTGLRCWQEFNDRGGMNF